MTFAVDLETQKTDEGFFRRAENWLDDRGKGAWIAVMVLGFIFFWPVGLALLAYMIWSKRMFSNGCAQKGAHRRHAFAEAHRMNRRHGFRSSGNTAFDAYKAETLKRLMDEQEQFEAFLDRLRAAKDKSEFDQFMDDRASAARDARASDEADDIEDGEAGKA
ncbi:DUF2852 domain-containing protein [Sinisalibacter aestuarii]|uniref:DUF2852 domain-containing protein n=1 Tax=Sinisalibacter aestuarii TaxID=2949426 RepID=A0ABQ5LVD8_9RHOB|nr:DUF2852 domain-containing protein [Sinisalibacter aestuarii]GKY88952.1 hypothetical protein STA1M1_28210 [Sinisalibacter aestuarii]